jgi:nucleoside-diphosphate-sugar epimerase
MKSENITFPANLGSEEKASINQLVDIVKDIAGVNLKRRCNLNTPKGVNGRNSEKTLARKMPGWEPKITLRDWLEKTYAWIHDQIAGGKGKDAVVNRYWHRSCPAQPAAVHGDHKW